MAITEKTALVTGASRGLGRQLTTELRDRGARVYAAARDPADRGPGGRHPHSLDITDPASVAAVAKATKEVTILVNNAGSPTWSSLLTGDRAPSDRTHLSHVRALGMSAHATQIARFGHNSGDQADG